MKSTIRGLSYICLGEFSTIQGEFEKVIASCPPFGAVDSPAPPYNTTHYYTAGKVINSLIHIYYIYYNILLL